MSLLDWTWRHSFVHVREQRRLSVFPTSLDYLGPGMIKAGIQWTPVVWGLRMKMSMGDKLLYLGGGFIPS